MSRSVACIDYRDGKILIAKRIPHGQMGDRWEFPGGKLESGEDFTQAIKREMKEEFDCGCQVFEEVAQGTFFHKGKLCSVTAFKIRLDKDGISSPFKFRAPRRGAFRLIMVSAPRGGARPA